LLWLVNNRLRAFANRLCHKRTDVLVRLVSGPRDKFVRFPIQVANHSVRKSNVAAATAFVGSRFLGHFVILVGLRATSALLLDGHHFSTPSVESTVGK
jgi:hypothetical protein